MILNFINNKQCCGCGACKEICPRKAIKMEEDSEGFLQPVLETDLCINCGICDNVCPIKNTHKTTNNIISSFAAINKDVPTLKKSSSGGLFSVIAEYIIKNGGIVYGASFDKNLKLSHKGIKQTQELECLRGSKYLQSNSFDCFPLIKKQLQNNQLVYFVGTGCQVAALKLYLRKEYNNLITSDLICHGVPSHKLFDTFVSTYETTTNRKIINYRCRDKYAGGWSGSQTVDYIYKNKIKRDLYHPILAGYMKAFMSADFFRESCYTCPFANEHRCGDITLADFWGVEKFHKINSINGVSAILINTEKGKKLFNILKSNIETIATQVEYIKKGNDNLRTPSLRTNYRNKSYIELNTTPKKVLERYINNSKILKYKFWIKHFMLHSPLYAFYYKIKNL